MPGLFSILTPLIELVTKVLVLFGVTKKQSSVTKSLGSQVRFSNLPRQTSTLIGRDKDFTVLKEKLLSRPASPIVIYGLPGVGKTSLALKVANYSEVQATFPGGALWVTLDQKPDVGVELAKWCSILSLPSQLPVPEMRTAISSVIQDRKVLIVLDDVWDSEIARLFFVGSEGSATLVTTRQETIARGLGEPGFAFALSVLNEAAAVQLLKKFSPRASKHDRGEYRDLARAVEYLPIALRTVAGLIEEEHMYGFGVKDVLEAIFNGRALLEANVPPAYQELCSQTSLTVAAVFAKSLERLSYSEKWCFANFGYLPDSIFDFRFVDELWSVGDIGNSRLIIRKFIDRGLIELVSSSSDNPKYRIHALFRMLARSLLTNDEPNFEIKGGA
ncbi:MAG TPA: NB-ARC domain-containing protein [Anaerolineales bacterium]|nr:NB-ARC domain-containing protein [Anaerolineales bacterium]HRQ92841.1 NB-ARC domain-containing protein [Anaerolineales bacterium]